MLLHVGFYKTATTTLQQIVFPRVGTVIGRRHDPEYKRVADLITAAPDSEYAAHEARAVIGARCRDADRPVISDEMLAGLLWYDTCERERTASRLHELLPNARVLITVRSQRSILGSIYGMYVKKGGYVRFSRLLENRVPTKRAHFDQLCWDTLVETYQTLYGRDRVEVVPYELLTTDPEAFLQRVTTLVDPDFDTIPVKQLKITQRSLSPGWQLVLRTTNRLFFRSHYNPNPAFPSDRASRIRARVEHYDKGFPLGARGQLSRGSERRLTNFLPRFAASNARLEQCTGLDLGQYGYPLPAG